jgi:hypothetical protein
MASAEGPSDNIALQEKSRMEESVAASAATGTPSKLSATTVVELIRIIRTLESTMNRHMEALGQASGASMAAAGRVDSSGAATEANAEGGQESNRFSALQPAVPKTLSRSRRSSSRLNGVVTDGLNTTKAVTRTDKVRKPATAC